MTIETTDETLTRKVDDLKTEGWKVKSESHSRVVMMRPNWGSLGMHLIVFLFTFWTFGLANAAYAAFCYMKRSDKRVVRPDKDRDE